MQQERVSQDVQYREQSQLGGAMSRRPLPPDMRERWGHLRHLQYKGSGEWSSECPVCHDSGHDPSSGKPDRFHMHEADGSGNARGACRRCGHFEWVDEDKTQPPDPARIKQAEELRREYAERERLRLRAKIQRLQEEAKWKTYHGLMKEQHRAIWRQAGIPDIFQDEWELGFVPEKTVNCNGRKHITSALSIPYFKAGRKAYNIQYRLMDPPRPNDKYRFSYGLKPGLWLPQPEVVPKGPCLLMEGMKKAGVAYVQLAPTLGTGYDIVSVPNKMPNSDMLRILKDCDPIYIILDPDAYLPDRQNGTSAAGRLGKLLGDRALYVQLPAKADDLFTLYGFDASDFTKYLRYATRTI